MVFGRTSKVVACVLGAIVVGGCGNKNEETPQAAAVASAPAASATESAPAIEAKVSATPPPASAHPPSTAPKKPTRAQADELMAATVAEYKQARRNCQALYQHWATGILYASAPAAIPATQAAARCAEATANAQHLLEAGSILAALDPASERHAYVPLALFWQGKPKEAWTALAKLNQKHPGEPEILYIGALQAAHEKDYPAALKLGDSVVKAVRASKDPDTKPYEWRAQLQRQKAHLFIGDLGAAERDIQSAEKAGAPEEATQELRKELVPMKMSKVGVDVTVPQKTFLGIYHLAGKAKGVPDLVDVEVLNFTGKDQVFKVEIEIPGVSDKVTKSVTVLKGKHEELHLTPPLKSDYKPAAQTAERAANVNVRVTMPSEGDKVVYEDVSPTTVYPRDQMPLARYGLQVAGAWITPQSAAIEEFVAAAKKRAPGGALPGADQAPTLPQVKAIFDELKARGMSYVLVSGSGAEQHVRLPSESIKSTNALCLDGAILFATLLEKIGFEPILVSPPGHAFVGWRAGPKDDPKQKVYFLETTMVGSASFEDAVAEGSIEVAQQEKSGNFESGAAKVLDVKAMRAAGITAQPYE